METRPALAVPGPPTPTPEASPAKARLLKRLRRHPFNEPWWLRGGHLQTIWSPFFRTRTAPPLRKERWTTPDEDFLNVYRLEGEERSPIVVLLHGLEGCVRSNYVLGLAAALARRAWSVAAVEHRSCGGEMNRARRLYHSGWTEDLAFVVNRLIQECPDRRIYLVGYSLGGNQIAKWLGELGERAPAQVAGAAVVSAPFDLTISGPHLDRLMRGAYVRWFLRTLIPKALAKERQYPGSLNVEGVRRARTFEEFDTHATAPLHGFRDAWDYWASCGCGQFLPGVRRPTVLISSADDPFNPGRTLPRQLAEGHPFLLPLFSDRGGHCGFVHGRSPRHSRHWAEEQVLGFLDGLEAIAAGRL